MKIDNSDLIQKWLQAFPNGWIQNCYEYGLHTIRCSHDMIPMSEPEAHKNILAIVFWRDGMIIKDESGLFIKVSPTVHKQYFGDSGLYTINGEKNIWNEKELGKWDKGFSITRKKCECGASAVGSNKHSNWCALNG